METFIDDKNNALPPFFAFAKSIKNKDVYVKAKIEIDEIARCSAFHFILQVFHSEKTYLINKPGLIGGSQNE